MTIRMRLFDSKPNGEVFTFASAPAVPRAGERFVYHATSKASPTAVSAEGTVARVEWHVDCDDRMEAHVYLVQAETK